MTAREKAFVQIMTKGVERKEYVDGRLGSGRIPLPALRNTKIGKQEFNRIAEIDDDWKCALFIACAAADGVQIRYRGELMTAEQAHQYRERGRIPPMTLARQSRERVGTLEEIFGNKTKIIGIANTDPVVLTAAMRPAGYLESDKFKEDMGNLCQLFQPIAAAINFGACMIKEIGTYPGKPFTDASRRFGKKARKAGKQLKIN